MEMWEAAREALKTAGRPMRPREIWVAIEDRGLFLTPGATPVSTLLNEMRKRLKGHRHRQQDMEPKCFSSPARGIYGLVEWNLSGDTAGGNAGPTEMGSTYRANRDRHEWCPPPVSAWRDSMEKPPMPRFNELKRASGSERDRLPTAMQLNNAIALAVKMAPSGRLLLEDLEAATLCISTSPLFRGTFPHFAVGSKCTFSIFSVRVSFPCNAVQGAAWPWRQRMILTFRR